MGASRSHSPPCGASRGVVEVSGARRRLADAVLRLLEQGRMHGGALVIEALRGVARASRVVIHGDRAAHAVVGDLHRRRVAVEGEVTRGEGDEAAEVRLDPLDARGEVAVPQLQVASVGVGPILVEVDEGVHAAVPHGAHAQVVEVRVDLQVPTRAGEVYAGALVARVRVQPFDTSQLLEERDERARAEGGEHLPRVRAHVVFARDLRLALLQRVDVAGGRPRRAAALVDAFRQLFNHFLQQLVRHHPVDRHVRERPLRAVRIAPPRRERPQVDGALRLFVPHERRQRIPPRGGGGSRRVLR
eukprot:CAMPEP_0182820628 /NCGR_PEP_ID=MMETSP0006_2-20121128/13231_1 /TAXON_ID=97485 /ORGANISM="Prymnesium parvum, Strain Texoma1" /LENGTH=301 /DNA_ID=CAMNT_0024947317 /DNA_START=374 /DNA_END=1275 /DNA_ORIENTATION=+